MSTGATNPPSAVSTGASDQQPQSAIAAGAAPTPIGGAGATLATPVVVSSAGGGTATAMAVDDASGNKSVQEVVAVNKLPPTKDPYSMLAAMSARLEAAEQQNALMRAEAESLKKREQERAAAEQKLRDEAQRQAQAAKKQEIDATKLKHEAAYQASLERVSALAPGSLSDADIAMRKARFHEELIAAGEDEARIEYLAKAKAEDIQLAVRASESHAAREQERRQRELDIYHAQISKAPSPPFSVSGGFAPTQQQQQQQQQAAPVALDVPTGAVESSSGMHTASASSVFDSILGKRHAPPPFDGNKRTHTSEVVGGSANTPATPALPAIDVTRDGWQADVLKEFLQEGIVPNEDLVRHGGVIVKHTASANGYVQKERVPRLQQPYDGVISMKEPARTGRLK